MYYLGDHGPDFIAATRWFIETFFIGNGIHVLFVHDGAFNPAKTRYPPTDPPTHPPTHPILHRLIHPPTQARNSREGQNALLLP